MARREGREGVWAVGASEKRDGARDDVRDTERDSRGLVEPPRRGVRREDGELNMIRSIGQKDESQQVEVGEVNLET